MSRWSEALKKTGDWMIVHDTDARTVASLVNHFIKTAYGPDACQAVRSIPGGVFVAAAYIPEGALQAYENRKIRIRMDRQERMENSNPHVNHATMMAEHEAKQKALAAAKKEFEEAEDPWEKYDGNSEDEDIDEHGVDIDD